MTPQSQQIELLKTKIADRIQGANQRRNGYRKKAFYAFISTAALAAFSSVLLGLDVGDEWKESVRIGALVISTIITLINTYNAFFNHKELWVANNQALNKFYQLNF